VTPIYLYFDLKRGTTQAVDKIAASFLKQIVWPPEMDIPHLKIIYESLNLRENRPTRDSIVKLFLQCAEHRKIKVLFDALDECPDDEQGELYQLIQMLFEAGIGVYITTRPHLFTHLKREFPDAVIEYIRANREDIRGFLEQRIKKHSRRDPVTSEFMETIVAKIGDAQGMYQPQIIKS
jgi:hypothetical protein